MTTSQVSTSKPLGDAVPAALANHYRALDGGNPAGAAAAFSEDALYAVPPAGGTETDPRSTSTGRDEIAERFRQRGAAPYVHELLLCAADAEVALVEGVTRNRSTGDPLSSFAASLQFDAEGLISRYVAYACTPPLVLSADDANPSVEHRGSAIDRIHDYFEALDDARFDDAASNFSLDTLYSHPPYKDPTVGGPGRADFVGREELAAAFGRRGPQRIDHQIVAHLQRGPHLLLEGVVNGDDGALLGTFVSSVSLDPAGLIRRYIAFYCQPGIPRV